MNTHLASCELELLPHDNERLLNLCGNLDNNVKFIESKTDTKIINRGNLFKIIGPQDKIKLVEKLLYSIYKQTKSQLIEPLNIHLELEKQQRKQSQELSDAPLIFAQNGPIYPLNPNQLSYIQNIKKYDINFGIGPAGTGKTFLAAVSAITALQQQLVQRIILVRPVVEAGEQLGFLPGDLQQKIDPYIRPLYDAFHAMLPIEQFNRYMSSNIIEISPLAYMRGRTLNNAFIILDESQNTTVDQMHMFLTRLGFNSKVVITGDPSQIDLPHNKMSGLCHAQKILQNIKGIKFNTFEVKDVARHDLVKDIIKAYAENNVGKTT